MALKCKILWIAKYLDKLIEKLCNRLFSVFGFLRGREKIPFTNSARVWRRKALTFPRPFFVLRKSYCVSVCFCHKFVMRTKICEWKGHWYNSDYFQILRIDQLVVVDIYGNWTNAISFCLKRVLRLFNSG